jgi:hypothetical protein
MSDYIFLSVFFIYFSIVSGYIIYRFKLEQDALIDHFEVMHEDLRNLQVHFSVYALSKKGE